MSPRNPGSPGGFDVAVAHNLGNTADSPYTSWTTNFDVAADYAGDGGVVLRLPTGEPPIGSTWKFAWSPDQFFEQEVLVEGLVSGATVVAP